MRVGNQGVVVPRWSPRSQVGRQGCWPFGKANHRQRSRVASQRKRSFVIRAADWARWAPMGKEARPK